MAARSRPWMALKAASRTVTPSPRRTGEAAPGRGGGRGPVPPPPGGGNRGAERLRAGQGLAPEQPLHGGRQLRPRRPAAHHAVGGQDRHLGGGEGEDEGREELGGGGRRAGG